MLCKGKYTIYYILYSSCVNKIDNRSSKNHGSENQIAIRVTQSILETIRSHTGSCLPNSIGLDTSLRFHISPSKNIPNIFSVSSNMIISFSCSSFSESRICNRRAPHCLFCFLTSKLKILVLR